METIFEIFGDESLLRMYAKPIGYIVFCMVPVICIVLFAFRKKVEKEARG